MTQARFLFTKNKVSDSIGGCTNNDEDIAISLKLRKFWLSTLPMHNRTQEKAIYDNILSISV